MQITLPLIDAQCLICAEYLMFIIYYCRFIIVKLNPITNLLLPLHLAMSVEMFSCNFEVYFCAVGLHHVMISHSF